MISHKHKCIFIHIPKCAGSSVKDFLFDGSDLDWRVPNYELLYGWCPKRRIHLQHATSKQLLEYELITETQWQEYFKFTIVRNPWDRAYSDYLWIMKDSKIKGRFQEYLKNEGEFKSIFEDKDNKQFRGDHKLPQTDFFDLFGDNKLDFVGRFENLDQDIESVRQRLEISKPFYQHSKKNENRKKHYSYIYRKTERKIVEELYKTDVLTLGYRFENEKKGLQRIKDLF